jgi:flagellin
MAAVLGTNVASLWASKNLQSAQSNMANSVERLSSGLRINRARDDAAGLGIGNALKQQINSANEGIRNLNDGISIVQTAEGAIVQASEMAQRMLSLAVQGTNGTLSQANRTSIKNELVSLMDGINGISTRTKIGSTSLFTVKQSQATATSISVFAGKESTDVVSLNNSAFYNIGTSFAVVGAARSTGSTSIALSVSSPSTYSSTTAVYKLSSGTLYALGTVSATNVAGSSTLILDRTGTADQQLAEGDVIVTDTSEYGLLGRSATTVAGRSVLEAVFNANLVSATASTAQTAFQSLTTAVSDYITLLSTQRGLLGAYQNQMEYSVNNVTELSANLTSARSRVIDTDYASETANLTKGQILQQAATAMLAQANQMPNVILSLLK